MLVEFANRNLKHLYVEGREKGKPVFGEAVVKAFIRKVDILYAVVNTRELVNIKSLHFEALKRDYKGYHSIRVNDQYRIILKVVKEKNGKESIEIIEIHDLTDYH
jgi:proteic killer suppression protein